MASRGRFPWGLVQQASPLQSRAGRQPAAAGVYGKAASVPGLFQAYGVAHANSPQIIGSGATGADDGSE